MSQPEHGQCEILVCDNGSTDQTASVVRAWEARDPHIRLISATRLRGPGPARNDGAGAARSQKLLFCDADDVVTAGWIAALVHALDHADIVVGGCYEQSRRPILRPSPPWIADARLPVYRGFFPHYPAGASANMAVRAEAFAEARGFDEGLRAGEDADLCWRIQMLGYQFGYSFDAMVAYTPRIGFMNTYRQAVVHGGGDRLLRERYSGKAHLPGPDRAPIMIGGQSEERFQSAPVRGRWSPGRLLGSIAWRLGVTVASRLAKQG